MIEQMELLVRSTGEWADRLVLDFVYKATANEVANELGDFDEADKLVRAPPGIQLTRVETTD